MAHRGGAIEHLENSLPAFEACVAMGYRYLETDVRVTADGVPIVFHDPTLDRVTDRRGRVDQLTWAELAGARIGGREAGLRLGGARRGPPGVRALGVHVARPARGGGAAVVHLPPPRRRAGAHPRRLRAGAAAAGRPGAGRRAVRRRGARPWSAGARLD